MRENHVLSSVQTGFHTVAVAFDVKPTAESQTWTYKSPDQLQALKGDKVVVQANNTFKVGTIMAVHDEPQIDLDSEIDYKWVVDKIDFTIYEAILKNEAEFIQSLRKMRQDSAKTQVVNALAAQYEGTPEKVQETIAALLDVSKVGGAPALESK